MHQQLAVTYIEARGWVKASSVGITTYFGGNHRHALASCQLILTLTMNPRIAAYAVLGFRSTAAFSSHPLLLPSPSRQTFNLGRSSVTQNMSTSTDDDVVDIAANIGHVRQMMDDAIASSERQSGSVRLVAVSKTKPLDLLQAAYEVRFI